MGGETCVKLCSEHLKASSLRNFAAIFTIYREGYQRFSQGEGAVRLLDQILCFAIFRGHLYWLVRRQWAGTYPSSGQVRCVWKPNIQTSFTPAPARAQPNSACHRRASCPDSVWKLAILGIKELVGQKKIKRVATGCSVCTLHNTTEREIQIKLCV